MKLKWENWGWVTVFWDDNAHAVREIRGVPREERSNERWTDSSGGMTVIAFRVRKRKKKFGEANLRTGRIPVEGRYFISRAPA